MIYCTSYSFEAPVNYRYPIWSLTLASKLDSSGTQVTVQYMVAEAQYGGRITDDLDRELFNTYAAKWFCPLR